MKEKNYGGETLTLTFEKVYEKVAKILVDELRINESEINVQSNFKSELGADSLAIIEIIMAIEDEFKIEIPDTDTENVDTVERMVKYILEKKNLA